MIWPDPMPLTEDLGKAYATYYTHASQHSVTQRGSLKSLKQSIEHDYWARHFGYQLGQFSLLPRILGRLYYLSPIHRREADAGIRCLQAVPNGRLLDVGCGSGDWLMMMRQFGWQVVGNDFDGNAVRVATDRGLQVSLGSLEQQHFPDNSFDAITLSHVIEHVPDPIQTMLECRRILKFGGKVVLFTPNCDSLSHAVFKDDWRGLEPPRHLHIFSLGSMEQLLARTGFNNRLVRPFIVTSVIYDSLYLRWGQRASAKKSLYHWLAWSVARVFKFLELCLIKWNPKVGDCLIATAEKPQ